VAVGDGVAMVDGKDDVEPVRPQDE
jgi:hypothetical protein